jgi:hypothetical protein
VGAGGGGGGGAPIIDGGGGGGCGLVGVLRDVVDICETSRFIDGCW